jgi:hypothetical protein
MDAISPLMSSIGGFFTNQDSGQFNWGNLGKVIGVAGLGDQFINNWMQNRAMNQYNKQQQMFQKNPTLAQNQITSMTQPLDQNLIAAVTNQVQGNLGAQGLAESPNIMASVMGQALAPYNQQNSAQATQLWEAIHGQPPMFGQANMNPLFAMLLRGFGNNNQNNFRPPSQGTDSIMGLDNIMFPGGGGSSSGGGTTNLGDLFNWGLPSGGATA